MFLFVIFVLGLIIISLITFLASNKSWIYKYNNNIIIVKNKTSNSSCELYINDQIYDRKTGVFFKEVNLQGKLESGEEILVQIGGGLVSVECNVKIDGKFVQYDEVKKFNLSAAASLFFGIISLIITSIILIFMLILVSTENELKNMIKELAEGSVIVPFIPYIYYFLIIVPGFIFGFISLNKIKTKYAKIGIILTCLSSLFIIIQMGLTISIIK